MTAERELIDKLYVALKAVVELLRVNAPGTILNNKQFDGVGIQANSALEKAESYYRSER